MGLSAESDAGLHYHDSPQLNAVGRADQAGEQHKTSRLLVEPHEQVLLVILEDRVRVLLLRPGRHILTSVRAPLSGEHERNIDSRRRLKRQPARVAPTFNTIILAH